MLLDRLLTMSDRSFELSDAARPAHQLFVVHQHDLLGMLQSCEWRKDLIQKGFGSDLEICSRVDITEVVPVMQEGRLVAERA